MMKETPFKHIWHITETAKDGDDIYLPGFYFVNEVQMLDGPYDNLEAARAELASYVEHL